MAGRGSAALRVEISQAEAMRLALRARGYTFSSIARDLAVSRPMVSMVMHGHATSKRVLAHIARLLGVPAAAMPGLLGIRTVSVSRRQHRVNGGLSVIRRQRACRG